MFSAPDETERNIDILLNISGPKKFNFRERQQQQHPLPLLVSRAQQYDHRQHRLRPVLYCPVQAAANYQNTVKRMDLRD